MGKKWSMKELPILPEEPLKFKVGQGKANNIF